MKMRCFRIETTKPDSKEAVLITLGLEKAGLSHFHLKWAL